MRNKQKKAVASIQYYLSKRPPEEIELMPLSDALVFTDGTPRLEGYQRLFAEMCRVEPDTVRVEYDALYVIGLNRMMPIVRGWVTL